MNKSKEEKIHRKEYKNTFLRNVINNFFSHVFTQLKIINNVSKESAFF